MPVSIIKQSKCKKLSHSAQGHLEYDIACSNDDFLFRITGNDQGGVFSSEWLSLKAVQQLLADQETFSASQLACLFESRNANMPGYITAVLTKEKLVVQVDGSQRIHRPLDDKPFKKLMNALVKKGVSLNDVITERQAEAEKKRLELEKELLATRKKNLKQASGKTKA